MPFGVSSACMIAGLSCSGAPHLKRCSRYLTRCPLWFLHFDFGLLILFGAVNLGTGLAMFSSGARLMPAAMAALIGTLEPVFVPIWVWLIHNEVPRSRTLIGALVVFRALLGHLLWQAVRVLVR